MRENIYIPLLLLGFIFMSSCSFDENELFEESASERLSNAIETSKLLLESASNGWTMHYYTGEQYTGGGYTLLMKFSEGKVTVASDYTDINATSTSSYDIIGDQGSVLTFNTYNSILHQRSEVSITNVEGEQGDYEFNIMRIAPTQDTIVLKGKKWNNYMTLIRNDNSIIWDAYLSQIEKMKNDMWYSYNIIAGSDTLGTMTLDPDTRRVTISEKDMVKSEPYYVTPKGISFPYGIQLGGDVVDKLDFQASDSTMVNAATDLKLKFFAPEQWYPYEDFLKNWVIYYNNWAGELHLKCEARSGTEILATFTYENGYDYTVTLKYNKAAGNLSWVVQNIEDPSGQYHHLKVLAYDSSTDYVSFMPNTGLTTTWGGYSFLLVDNGVWTGYNVDGLIFGACDASDNLLGVYPVQLMNLAGGYMYEDQSY